MKIDYSVILSLLAAQFGPLIAAVLGVGALIVGLMVALPGTERVLSLVSGQEAKFAKRYELERRARRKKRDDDSYGAYRLRRERQAANWGAGGGWSGAGDEAAARRERSARVDDAYALIRHERRRANRGG